MGFIGERSIWKTKYGPSPCLSLFGLAHGRPEYQGEGEFGMINRYDIAYGIGVGLASPFWLVKPSARKKVLRAFSQRMGKVAGRDLSKPAIMIHAVSLGEINAARALVDLLREKRKGLHFVVSVTTETGFARAMELYGSAEDVTLARYPLDFSPAVDRLLGALKPKVVVLLELEVWPNFIRRCADRGIAVILINGRITAASYRKYRMARVLIGAMFRRLHRVCAQDETYAKRFVELGVAQSRVSLTGTMKFDTAHVADRMEGQEELAAAVGLRPGERPIWVCGSSGPGEEEMILGVYRRLVGKFANLQLVIVPRKPERFNEVAEMIKARGLELVRRSETTKNLATTPSRVVLGDTMGELRKFYALADVVFCGRSLVDLGDKQHGSDMIEPAALGKPVIVGPYTTNFADAMERFVEGKAMDVVKDAGELEKSVERYLSDKAAAKEMGSRAREVVVRQRGATERHAEVILEALNAALAGEQARP